MISHPRNRLGVRCRNGSIEGFPLEVPYLPFPLEFGGGVIIIAVKLSIISFMFSVQVSAMSFDCRITVDAQSGLYIICMCLP